MVNQPMPDQAYHAIQTRQVLDQANYVSKLCGRDI